MAAKIDFVTVVFAHELPLLKLQARSISRFASPDLIGKIIVIINDQNEDDLIAPLESLKEEYGAFAPRVEIVRPEQIFSWDVGPKSALARMKAVYTRHRAAIPFERQTGWRKHRGWQLQQAMKLSSVRRAVSDYVVILDAKNHFLAPIDRADFVAPNGKPLTYYEDIGVWQKRWFRDACKIIGIDPSMASDKEYMPSMTPFVVARPFLSDLLKEIEAKAGPVQVLFGTKRDEVTEFTLIFAYCLKRYGAVTGAFQLGLEPAAFTIRDGNAAYNQGILARIETGGAKCLGLHRLSIKAMTDPHKRRICEVWAKSGLVGSTGEGLALMDDVQGAV